MADVVKRIKPEQQSGRRERGCEFSQVRRGRGVGHADVSHSHADVFKR
jgi:hypothetical protein